MNATIGIDPGVEGAAVLLLDGRAAMVAFWQPERRVIGTSIRIWRPGQPEIRREVIPNRASACGAAIAMAVAASQGAPFPSGKGGITLACEDFFLGKNPGTLIKISRWGGGVVAMVEQGWGVGALWVRGDEWRAPILGLPRGTPREAAKEASCELMPVRLPSLAPLLLRLEGEQSHICDAAGVAQWAELRGGVDEVGQARSRPADRRSRKRAAR